LQLIYFFLYTNTNISIYQVYRLPGIFSSIVRYIYILSVLRIWIRVRIRRIHMFRGLWLWPLTQLYNFTKWCINVPSKSNKQKHFF
jgi:hypothetical protein